MTVASAGMREYLAEIYRLQEDSPIVSTTALAEQLNVSAPAVPRMLRRLANAGYVTHRPYQGVELKEAGRQLALNEIRRHRICERFLVDVMGFRWDDSHDHAHSLAAGLNEALTERMAEMTGQPTRCPHGEPIPDHNGHLPKIEDMNLVNLGVGRKGKISRVRTHDGEKLRYFASLGVLPDQPFEVIGRAPFNGPMTLRLAQQEITLGMGLVQSVWVSSQADTPQSD